MLTKKSLIIGLALLLSIVCAGSAGAFASSVTPGTPQSEMDLYPADGISAIAPDNTDDLITAENIEQYVGQQGFVGGSTSTRKPPTIQVLRLTDLSSLKKLAGLVIPGLSGDRQVYYTKLKGPFTLNHDLPMSTITTLLPSANNWAILRKLPAISQVQDLNSLPLLNDLEGSADTLYANLPVLANQPAGKLFNDSSVLTLNNPDLNATNVLPNAYEVFDALSGNLLAWG